MTLQPREKRALALLGIIVPLVIIYLAVTPSGPATVKVVAPVDSVAAAEKRLAKLRDAMARVPGMEDVRKQADADLAEREKGLIVADTGQQAQAHLLEVVRRL